MAKADDTTSKIDWIWLRDALALAIAAFGTVALAKERLTKWLAAGKLPWCAEGKAKLRLWSTDLEIDWEDNRAHEIITINTEYGLTWRYGAEARGIQVSRTHLLALLPGAPNEHDDVRGAGVWIAAEAKRMNAANKIKPGIRISQFARDLANAMDKAALSDKCIRPIGAKSIENKLRDWGLWPISSIK